MTIIQIPRPSLTFTDPHKPCSGWPRGKATGRGAGRSGFESRVEVMLAKNHGAYQIDGMKFPDFSLIFPGYIFSSKYMSSLNGG